MHRCFYILTSLTEEIARVNVCVCAYRFFRSFLFGSVTLGCVSVRLRRIWLGLSFKWGGFSVLWISWSGGWASNRAVSRAVCTLERCTAFIFNMYLSLNTVYNGSLLLCTLRLWSPCQVRTALSGYTNCERKETAWNEKRAIATHTQRARNRDNLCNCGCVSTVSPNLLHSFCMKYGTSCF